jgi:hypothetical protein
MAEIFNIENPKDGIYHDLSIENYHENRTHLSSSRLKPAMISMNDFYWNEKNPPEDVYKSHFDFGNVVECAVLSRHSDLVNKIAIFDPSEKIQEIEKERPEIKSPTSTKEFREWKNQFHIDNKDKYIINKHGKESWEEVEFILENCMRDAAIQKAINNTEDNISIFWTDKTSGLKLKTRPDLMKVSKNNIIDVKTTLDAHPFKFSRKALQLGYPLQALMQIDGAQQSGLIEKVDNYFYLALQKTPPYHAVLYRFHMGDVMNLWDSYEELKLKIANSVDNDFYCGFSDKMDVREDGSHKLGILDLKIPPYYSLYEKY